jgi:hypothetical protein
MICSKCGIKANSELCFKCKPKKPLSSGKGLSKRNIKIFTGVQGAKSFEKSLLLKEFFELCWKNKPHYSEVSGKFLGNKCSSLYQHHILAKSKYPEACLDEENIVFLTPDEHASVELDMYKYEYINEKRKKLLVKYERT